MRILLLNLEREGHGIAHQSVLLATTLQQEGHQISLVVNRSSSWAHSAAAAGVSIIEVGHPIGLAFYLLRHASQFDIIHVQTAAALSVVAGLKGFIKNKVVYTHDEGAKQDATREVVSMPKAWHRVDAFVATHAGAATVLQDLGVEVALIPNAIAFASPNMDEIMRFSDAYDLSGKYVVATCAAVTHENDPALSIRAIHALWQKRQDFVFLHFGEAGDAHASAQALIAELGLQEVYQLVGHADRLEDMYRLMHVFISTASDRLHSRRIVEAFSYEAAVVASHSPRAADLLADGRGVLCEQGDFSAMAHACDELLEDVNKRQHYTNEAERWVSEEHAVSRMANGYLDVYKSLV